MTDFKSFFIEGKCAWAKILKPALDYDGDNLEYSINIYTDKSTFKGLKDLALTVHENGSKTKLYTDDAGETFLTLRKPVLSASGDELKKPLVFDKYGDPVTELIGNGSIVRVKLSLFSYSNNKGGAGIRFEAVQVLDHIIYHTSDQSEGFDFEEKPEVDMEEVVEKASKEAEIFNDDIPF